MELKLEQVVIRDEELVVFFPEETTIEGELVIAPLHEFKTIEELPDFLIEKIFHVANKMSTSLFEILGCHGTNLLIQNGTFDGQKTKSVLIRIIPRFENDTINLKWTPKPSSPEDLENTVKAFKNHEEDQAKQEFLKKQKESTTKKEPEKTDNNYLLKSLRRNP